jgi:hypothetical protein
MKGLRTMNAKRNIALVVGVVGRLLLAGCAKAPQADIDAAKAAIAAAKGAEANVYVADKFAAAEKAMADATAEIEKQNGAFAMSRNYAQAKTLLAGAAQQAQAAQQEAVTQKAAVKTEAENTLAAVQTALIEAKALLAKAPKGKEGKEALQAMSAELAMVDSSLVSTQTLIQGGQYATALDNLNAAKAKVEQIKGELQTAIDKSKGKKSK